MDEELHKAYGLLICRSKDDFVRVYEKGILPPDTTNNDTTNNDTTTTSITDIENLMVSLYPNPSNGYFTIQSSSIIQSVEIFDVYGQKVAYFEGLGYHAEVDMLQPKGLYIVKVRHQEGDVILRHMLE